MEDRRERLARMMREYDGTHDEWLRRLMFFFGRRLKKMNHPVGRFLVSNVTTKLSARAIVKWGLFGVEARPDMTVEEMALNWMKMSLFFRIPTELGEVTEDHVIVLRPECTVGFKDPEDCKICRASMNMDMEMMRLLGGKLTVTETILEGAHKCRHILEKA